MSCCQPGEQRTQRGVILYPDVRVYTLSCLRYRDLGRDVGEIRRNQVRIPYLDTFPALLGLVAAVDPDVEGKAVEQLVVKDWTWRGSD